MDEVERLLLPLEFTGEMLRLADEAPTPPAMLEQEAEDAMLHLQVILQVIAMMQKFA
jgi:hypothetical protein